MTRIKYKEAVGIQAERGKLSIGAKPSKSKLKRLYEEESRSIREIAELMGCSKDMVYRALKDYGIKRRDHREKRSQLQEYNFSFLKKEIRLKGFNRVASELGVHNTTLRRYIEKEKSQR